MKKLLSTLLATILLLAPMCAEAYASDGNVNYDDLVMPCYANLNSIRAGISEGILGFVTCTSNVVATQSDKTYVLTCTLQRTDGTSGWSDYKTKTETFTGVGSFTIEKDWFAPANYIYRTYTYLTVKNSSGAVVETASTTSDLLSK